MIASARKLCDAAWKSANKRKPCTQKRRKTARSLNGGRSPTSGTVHTHLRLTFAVEHGAVLLHLPLGDLLVATKELHQRRKALPNE